MSWKVLLISTGLMMVHAGFASAVDPSVTVQLTGGSQTIGTPPYVMTTYFVQGTGSFNSGNAGYVYARTLIKIEQTKKNGVANNPAVIVYTSNSLTGGDVTKPLTGTFDTGKVSVATPGANGDEYKITVGVGFIDGNGVTTPANGTATVTVSPTP